jgi:transcriptional regulator with XRE-family HTH domain
MPDTIEKVPYSEWQRGREIIKLLQNQHGMSLTDISRAVKGDGDTPGWADSAYHYRGMMSPAQFRRLAELLADATTKPKPNGNGEIQNRRLTDDENDRFCAMLRTLRDVDGMKQSDIGAVIGVDGSNITNYLRGKYKGSLRTLLPLEEYMAERLATLDDERAFAALAADAESASMEELEAASEILDNLEGPVVEKQSDFASQLAQAREAAAALVGEMEMLGAASPTFARRGIEELLDRLKEIVRDLDG